MYPGEVKTQCGRHGANRCHSKTDYRCRYNPLHNGCVCCRYGIANAALVEYREVGSAHAAASGRPTVPSRLSLHPKGQANSASPGRDYVPPSVSRIAYGLAGRIFLIRATRGKVQVLPNGPSPFLDRDCYPLSPHGRHYHPEAAKSRCRASSRFQHRRRHPSRYRSRRPRSRVNHL